MTPENESNEGYRSFESRDALRTEYHGMGELLLPVVPSTVAECYDGFLDGEESRNSSRSNRFASFSWDWDEPPKGISPRSGRPRGRTDSTCASSSCSMSPFCRSSALSFTIGDSATAEFSSPESPGYCIESSYSFPDEEMDGVGDASDLRMVVQDQAILSRRLRSIVVPQRRRSEIQKDTIYPADLSEGDFDYQGIPWPRFSISRNDYRSKRLREYSNYNNVTWNSQLELRRRLDITRVESVRTDMFLFHETFKLVNPSIDHFQLRHLLWSTSNNTSFLVSNSTLFGFNRKSRLLKRVNATNPQQLACCHVEHGLAATGSFDSEVRVTKLEDMSEVLAIKVSNEPNSITNHVVIVNESRIVVANNDSHLTEIDVAGNTVSSKFKWIEAVNHVSVSPLGNTTCLTGDSCDVSLIDRRSLEPVGTLSGHLDFSFCSSWSSENVVCTGSQDGTCRVWDTRNLSKSVACLGSLLGAVRSAKFSPDGRYLALSEPADFVHIYDVETGFRECQVLDFFGNIAGIAFSPDSTKLSVSLADTMFGCLIDFQVGSLPLNTHR